MQNTMVKKSKQDQQQEAQVMWNCLQEVLLLSDMELRDTGAQMPWEHVSRSVSEVQGGQISPNSTHTPAPPFTVRLLKEK